VVEAASLKNANPPSYDDRAIALAQGTQRILATIGVWDGLVAAATPIHQIHVSDRGRFGFTRLDRKDEGVEALGYVVPAREIGAALMEILEQHPSVEMIWPARLEQLDVGEDVVTVGVSGNGKNRELTARLVVAADGGASAVRERLAMPVDRWDYGQTAIVTNVTTQLPTRNIAFERFTDSGPLALLPMGEHQCTVVWTVSNDDADTVLRSSDSQFLQGLQERFGYRLGRLTDPGKRAAYPLQLVRAKDPVQQRVALIGNAAHTLHPIAGQGFNLGARDVAALAEVLVDGMRAGAEIGDADVLQRYAKWRERDHNRVTAFTDGLIRLFTNPLASVSMVRNVGMLALECIPATKKLFGRFAMGKAGKLPRLSRGLPL